MTANYSTPAEAPAELAFDPSEFLRQQERLRELQQIEQQTEQLRREAERRQAEQQEQEQREAAQRQAEQQREQEQRQAEQRQTEEQREQRQAERQRERQQREEAQRDAERQREQQQRVDASHAQAVGSNVSLPLGKIHPGHPPFSPPTHNPPVIAGPTTPTTHPGHPPFIPPTHYPPVTAGPAFPVHPVPNPPARGNPPVVAGPPTGRPVTIPVSYPPSGSSGGMCCTYNAVGSVAYCEGNSAQEEKYYFPSWHTYQCPVDCGSTPNSCSSSSPGNAAGLGSTASALFAQAQGQQDCMNAGYWCRALLTPPGGGTAIGGNGNYNYYTAVNQCNAAQFSCLQRFASSPLQSQISSPDQLVDDGELPDVDKSINDVSGIQDSDSSDQDESSTVPTADDVANSATTAEQPVNPVPGDSALPDEAVSENGETPTTSLGEEDIAASPSTPPGDDANAQVASTETDVQSLVAQDQPQAAQTDPANEVANAVAIQSEGEPDISGAGSGISAPATEVQANATAMDEESRKALNAMGDGQSLSDGGTTPSVNMDSSADSEGSATEEIDLRTEGLAKQCPNGQCEDQLPIIGHTAASALGGMNNCFSAFNNDSMNCDPSFTAIPTEETKTAINNHTGGLLDKFDAAKGVLNKVSNWWSGGTQQPADSGNDSQLECVNCRAPQGNPYWSVDQYRDAGESLPVNQ